MSDRPFIIYTAQRTGGTNFAVRLAERSARPAAPEHEPFNVPRVYGHITKAWAEDGDRAALDRAMAEICGRGEIVKHCVETVPVEITEALVDAALAAGYGHLFLYRADPVARLLSIEYARRTRIFGPARGTRQPVDLKGRLHQLRRMARFALRRARDGRIFDEPLDIEALLAREETVTERLNATWHRLVAAGAAPVAISYEALYDDDPARARKVLAAVLDRLGLSQGTAEDDALLDSLRARGNQGTRDRYSRFQGVDALRQGTGRLPPLAFARCQP